MASGGAPAAEPVTGTTARAATASAPRRPAAVPLRRAPGPPGETARCRAARWCLLFMTLSLCRPARSSPGRISTPMRTCHYRGPPGPKRRAGRRLAPGRGAGPVNPDGAHQGQVDHQAALRHRQAGDIVASSADADFQAMVAAEAHRRGHISSARAAGDDRRALVNHRVPDSSRLVVAVLVRQQNLSLDLAVQCCGMSVHWLLAEPP